MECIVTRCSYLFAAQIKVLGLSCFTVEYLLSGTFWWYCGSQWYPPAPFGGIRACLLCALADTFLFFACRQAQDKLSDVAAQAQIRAQELARDVSTSNSVYLAAARPAIETHMCLSSHVMTGSGKDTTPL